ELRRPAELLSLLDELVEVGPGRPGDRPDAVHARFEVPRGFEGQAAERGDRERQALRQGGAGAGRGRPDPVQRAREPLGLLRGGAERGAERLAERTAGRRAARASRGRGRRSDPRLKTPQARDDRDESGTGLKRHLITPEQPQTSDGAAERRRVVWRRRGLAPWWDGPRGGRRRAGQRSARACGRGAVAPSA